MNQINNEYVRYFVFAMKLRQRNSGGEKPKESWGRRKLASCESSKHFCKRRLVSIFIKRTITRFGNWPKRSKCSRPILWFLYKYINNLFFVTSLGQFWTHAVSGFSKDFVNTTYSTLPLLLVERWADFHFAYTAILSLSRHSREEGHTHTNTHSLAHKFSHATHATDGLRLITRRPRARVVCITWTQADDRIPNKCGAASSLSCLPGSRGAHGEYDDAVVLYTIL